MSLVNDLSSDLAPQLAVELGLKPNEYERIAEILGRTPTVTELYMYSLMWSEHCSYKHSRKHLRMFPTEGPFVLQGPGENAGVISVGDGWAVAFKMESHNHPSAIEPYQGAATGVGGIIRDIFTMGARPIAILNSLRFGTLDKPRQRYLFEGAVAGIGGYGNCLGVPTVGGEVYFEDAYEGNCLINAMAIGLMREENLIRAQASGVGNKVVLIGSTTGRDGIGGASVLASQEFDEGAEAKRPAVQVGDPFEEKLLIEACLELLDRKLLVALGDLGAAGLTSSAAEMADRGGVGLDIDVSKVPQRELNMKPFEIMVSESQERMLAVVEPEQLDEVLEVCHRWGLLSTVIGEVTDTGNFVVRSGDELHAEIPASTLADDAPLYDPPMVRPAYLDELAAFDPHSVEHPETVDEFNEALLALLAAPNICSRKWIWEQYDHQVGCNTIVKPGSDAAVIRIGDTGRGEMTGRGIAATSDCNGRLVYLNPYRGAQIAFAEAARNIACTGATPAAITDCLNFGSPEKPEVYWTFHESIRGLADACKAFEVPVISGNVSFYNESFGQPIYPTPTVGMVGLVDDVSRVAPMAFQQAGDMVVLLGKTLDELGGSEYLHSLFGVVGGEVPSLDLTAEAALHRVLRDGISQSFITAAHDCSDGGAAVAIAEMAVASGLGCEVALEFDGVPVASALFGESQSRALVTINPDNVARMCEMAEAAGVTCTVIGWVGGDRVVVEGHIDVPLNQVSDAYLNSMERIMEGKGA